MKLSTKLLIGLAIFLFVVPTLVASYFVRINRVDANVYHANVEKEVSNPNAADVYFRSFPVGKFDKLQILGSDARGINLHVVKSDKFMVKVNKSQADLVKTKIEADGVLVLDFLEGGDKYYKSVYIFTPDLKILKLKKADINEFSAKLDEFTIVGDSVENFTLSGETAINTLNLVLTNSHIDDFGYRDDKNTAPVSHLRVDITNTNLGLPRVDYKTADILAKNSEVYFNRKGDKSRVDVLDIKTEGVSSVRLDSLQWNTLNGRLSNDTKIDLPVHALRNLIK
ncbi:hypothetical protein BWD42_09720 [Sphingobacterium sp. CZ-UAM]|uniref:hypothetical protein n=1 Tax=Sphingobacterium sp. CZ-UAM TaxID=1933868 RepID=UPI000984F5D1|nr:hypothetical protein [Sphingobacterium sp. CZ-UAM]OOG20137.1 hypothetical protein BWD42_09720 [Sphingobacterium sp. CZ-UAM]